MNPAAIFQRTYSGQENIKTKSYRLTQSERLLLIIIDGVTPYSKLREEVWALSQERFDKALKTLLDANLIIEVLFPLADQEPEEIEPEIKEKFLQQDPLDPVTIISFDPEDEFGTDDNSLVSLGMASSEKKDEAPRASETEPTFNLSAEEFAREWAALPDRSSEVIPAAALLESRVPREIPETQEVKQLEPLALPKVEERVQVAQLPPLTIGGLTQPQSEVINEWPDIWETYLKHEKKKTNRIQWFSWITLGGGVLLIVLYAVFRIRH